MWLFFGGDQTVEGVIDVINESGEVVVLVERVQVGVGGAGRRVFGRFFFFVGENTVGSAHGLI